MKRIEICGEPFRFSEKKAGRTYSSWAFYYREEGEVKRRRKSFWGPRDRSAPPPSKQSKAKAKKHVQQHILPALEKSVEARERKIRSRKPEHIGLRDAFELAKGDPGNPRGGRTELSQSSVDLRRVTLEQFYDFVTDTEGEIRCKDVTPAMHVAFEQSLRKKGNKRGGIERKRNIIRRAFNYLIKMRFLPHDFQNPVLGKSYSWSPDVERQKCLEEAYSAKEEKAIFAALERGSVKRSGKKPPLKLPSWIHTLSLIARYSGMRQGEIRQLLWSDVDLVRGIISIRFEVSKSGRPRQVPILPEVDDLFRRLHRERGKSVFVVSDEKGNQLRKDRITKKMRGLTDALGIHKTQAFHAWRHSFGFWAADFVPIHKLQAVMGHSSIRQTEIYCRGNSGSIAQEIREKAFESRRGAKGSNSG